jgi:hypothetical protein
LKLLYKLLVVDILILHYSQTVLKETMLCRTFLLLAFLPSAYSYASQTAIVECVDIAEDTGTTFEVCGIYSAFGPSPAQLENGTTIYIGGYSNDYTIVQGLEAGTDTSSGNISASVYPGIEISVFRDDADICGVTVTAPGSTDKEACSTCTYCGNETYSADCTNLENGRDVNCESTVSIFFPLTAEALKVDASSSATTPTLSPNEVVDSSDDPPGEANSTLNNDSTSSAGRSNSLIYLIGCVAALLLHW